MIKEKLWQAVLGELELSLSKANFTTWLKKTFISSIDDDCIVIGVPNAFTQTWLQNKYHKNILTTLQNLTDDKIKRVNYKVEIKQIGSSAKSPEDENKIKVVEKKVEVNRFGLNPRYTFQQFVVGKNNELAHATCQAIAKYPGQKYNPVFIYSGVGLGKTHLIQAVGHQVLSQYPKKRILYVSCEKFTNEYIQSVREGKAKEFKNLYRNVDLLLIDDIQFMTGKEGTQQEFFHTFNELHQKNKQIMITSDRAPKAIPGLEERLSSRFGWGMIADISRPDLEMRMAILKSKCQEKNYSMEEDIVHYLATYIQNNVRELEGALNKIIAYHELNNFLPNLESVKGIVSNLISQTRQGAITPKYLIKIVADFFELKIEDMLGGSRTKSLALPRQIAMYLLRKELNTSYPAIGQELGNRDHTTAIHAYNKIREKIDSEDRIKQDVEMIKERLYN